MGQKLIGCSKEVKDFRIRDTFSCAAVYEFGEITSVGDACEVGANCVKPVEEAEVSEVL